MLCVVCDPGGVVLFVTRVVFLRPDSVEGDSYYTDLPDDNLDFAG